MNKSRPTVWPKATNPPLPIPAVTAAEALVDVRINGKTWEEVRAGLAAYKLPAKNGALSIGLDRVVNDAVRAGDSAVISILNAAGVQTI